MQGGPVILAGAITLRENLMRLAIFTLTAAVALAGVAHASSPDAWLELQKNSRAACIAASGLKKAKVTAYVETFEAYAVLVVEGVTQDKYTKGAKAKYICLYDKQTEKAEAQQSQ